MGIDTSFLTWIISTALMLVTGFVALIRRIDNNKKLQEIRDIELKAKIDKTLLKIDHLDETTRELKITTSAIIEKMRQQDQELTILKIKQGNE